MTNFLYEYDDWRTDLPQQKIYAQSPTRNRRSFLRSESSTSILTESHGFRGDEFTYQSASSLRSLSSMGGFTSFLPTPPSTSFESLRLRRDIPAEGSHQMLQHSTSRDVISTPVVGFQGPPTPEYTPPKSIPKRKRSVNDLAGLCLRVSETTESQTFPMSENQSRHSSNIPARLLLSGGNRQSTITEFEEGFPLEPFPPSLDSPISTDEGAGGRYTGKPAFSHFVAEEISIRSSSSDSSSNKRRRRNENAHDSPLMQPIVIAGTGSVRRRPRTDSLKDRIAQRDNSLDHSPKLVEFARQIQWPVTPSADDQPLAYATNTNRISNFSTLSANSRTVEAVILNTPPEKHHSLRRTRRLGALSLLSRSSPFQSRIFGRASHGSQKRRVSAEQIPLQKSMPARENVGQVSSEVPVVVIGERQSSMRANTEGDKPKPQTLYAASQQAMIMSNGSGVYDQTPPARGRRREIAESMTAAITPTRGTSEMVDYPTIPRRGSSLSAPTSRNTSRTSTMTSGRPLYSRRASEDRRASAGYRTARSRNGSLGMRTPRKRSEDLAHISVPHYRRSLESGFSPYSMSPEVREARAISIIAHHSDAVRMIGGLSKLPHEPAGVPGEFSDGDDDGMFPDGLLLSIGEPGAGKTPAFHITPPTPDMTQDVNKPLPRLPHWPQAPLVGSPAVTRAVSLMKRGLSLSGRASRSPSMPPARRASISPEDAAIPPDIQRFARVSLDDTRNRLHPKWKPRTSMSRLEDLEYERRRRPATSDGEYSRRPVTSSAGPRHGPSAFKAARTTHRIPGTPVHIEYLGWGGFRERMRESRQNREERKREKSRERLKQMIGPRVMAAEE